jgi:hypothetical protein
VTGVREHETDQLPRVGVILDDQNVRHACFARPPVDP